MSSKRRPIRRKPGQTWTPEVFMRFVEIQASGCWHWTGSRDGAGYGRLSDPLRPKSGSMGAHRLSYEMFVGPIPEGLHIDHLCRVPRCVNPEHLEPVTQRENTLRGIGQGALNARKTHCHRGHEYTPENTYHNRSGLWRHCKTCFFINKAAREARAS